MITPEQGLTILQDTIKRKLRHRDYDRTVALAELYHQLISGDGIESLLQQFVRRETDTEFAQRVALTQEIVSPLAESIITPFYRPGRLDNIRRGLFYDGDNGTRADALKQVLSRFYGQEDIERYLATRFADLNFSDPNAFILVDFDRFDARQQQLPQPYPYEVSSAEAINYLYKNNLLQWLVCHTVKEEINPDTNRNRKREKYYMYLAGYVWVATQVIDDSKELPIYEAEALEQGLLPIKDYTKWNDNYVAAYEASGKRFTFELYQTRTELMQAVRVGYKPDKVTKGRTYVSPMQPAVPYLKQIVKRASELDLSVNLHVFPQKAIFEEACPGYREPSGTMNPCAGGSDQFGNTCKKCDGTGILVHRSAQDIMVYPMPRKQDKNDVIPLKDRQHYYELPIHIVEWLDNHIDKLAVKAVKAVFNSDIVERPQFAATATEVIENKEEMTNTLFPFTERYSAVYKDLVRLCAAFTDLLTGLTVLFEFPSDFRLKTEAQMLAELKAAQDAGATPMYIQQIEDEIVRKRLADDDEAYKKYKVKTLFTPFLGKSEQYIMQLFASNDVRPEDKVLYNYVDSIFDELQMEVPGFFDLAFPAMNALVMKKVQAILDTLPKMTLSIDFAPDTDSSNIETPIDIEAESKAKLKGSVGGTQGILQIQESVAKGVTQYEAAVVLLYEIYGFDEATARKLLGNPTQLKEANPDTITA